MDEEYLTRRMNASLTMARNAAGSCARLIHFDLAGRYSVAAAAAASRKSPTERRGFLFNVSSFGTNDGNVTPLFPPTVRQARRTAILELVQDRTARRCRQLA